MKIMALDLASRVGWAHSDKHGGVIDLRSSPPDYERMAHVWRRRLEQLLMRHPAHIVVAEMPPPTLKGNARLILLGLHWQTRGVCHQFQIPLRSVGVSVIKRFATGNAKADKEEMIKAAVNLGREIPVDDNHADAMLICAWAEKNVA